MATDQRPLDLRAFIRLYQPHAAWEGSVLFPAFRKLLPPAEFLKLGSQSETTMLSTSLRGFAFLPNQ